MGFQYNGITSQSMSVKAHLTGWQMVPTLRSNTETVPGKAGLADFGADSGERYIDVACNVYPQKTFADMVAILDQVAAWLDPTAGTKQLVLDDVPDRYFMARLNAAVECERLLRSSGSFDLTFFCPDPFGYAIEDETFSITEAGNSTVTRLIGNMESNPIYRIEGVITSGASNSISITTNGQELKIVNATLAAGETLVVDTDRMTAYVEDADGMILRNALPYLEELNFPTLAVGSNTVSVTAANATFTGLEIQARSRWR